MINEGENLKYFLKHNKYTQTSFGNSIGLSQQIINRCVKTGIVSPLIKYRTLKLYGFDIETGEYVNCEKLTLSKVFSWLEKHCEPNIDKV